MTICILCTLFPKTNPVTTNRTLNKSVNANEWDPSTKHRSFCAISSFSPCSSSCFPSSGIGPFMFPILFLLSVLLYHSNVYYSSEVQSLPLNSTCIIRRTTKVKEQSPTPIRRTTKVKEQSPTPIRRTTTVDVQSPPPIQRTTTVEVKSHTPKRRRTKGKVQRPTPKRRRTKGKVQRPTPAPVVVNAITDESIARCDRLCGTVGNELYLHCSASTPSNAATAYMLQAFRDGIVLLLTI